MFIRINNKDIYSTRYKEVVINTDHIYLVTLTELPHVEYHVRDVYTNQDIIDVSEQRYRELEYVLLPCVDTDGDTDGDNPVRRILMENVHKGIDTTMGSKKIIHDVGEFKKNHGMIPENNRYEALYSTDGDDNTTTVSSNVTGTGFSISGEILQPNVLEILAETERNESIIKHDDDVNHMDLGDIKNHIEYAHTKEE